MNVDIQDLVHVFLFFFSGVYAIESREGNVIKDLVLQAELQDQHRYLRANAKFDRWVNPT